MQTINLSMLKSEKIRCNIPAWINEEIVGDIVIENPTQEYVNIIKERVSANAIDNDFKLDMIRNLTNINIDCEFDEQFFKYYNSILASVMIEIDSIIFEITSDCAMEVYSLNKMSENKKEMLNQMVEIQSETIKESYKQEEQKKKAKEIMDAEAEFQLAQEKLNFLKGE